MNYIVEYAENPNSFTPDEINELKTALFNAIKRKISNLEKKYKIKFKFPNGLCGTKDNTKLKLPIFSSPIIISPIDISIYTPFDVAIGDFSDEGAIDRLQSCLNIVSSVKRELEEYEDGKLKKESIDDTFFDWITEKEQIVKEEKVYNSEIEEMYDKKFGKNALIKNIIKRIESTQPL